MPDLKQAEEFFSKTFGCVLVTHIGPFKLDASGAEGDAKFAPRADSVYLSMLRCGTGSNIELFEYRNSKGSKDIPKLD